MYNDKDKHKKKILLTFCISISTENIRPPTRLHASRILKLLIPFLIRWFAADNPAIPAPIIITLYFDFELDVDPENDAASSVMLFAFWFF